MSGSKLGRLLLGAAMAFVLDSVSLAVDGETQSKDCGWCVITCPKEASPGTKFDVTVELKGLKEKTKLGADLHWMKSDGSWGGSLAWGGAARDVEKDGPLKFSYKFDVKEGMASAHVMAYLSPDGSWGKQTKNTTGPTMPLKITEEMLKNMRPKEVAFNKSSIYIRPVEGAYKEGDEFEVTVDYFLDPSESWGSGTSLFFMPLGPWIDNPDGKYSKNRHHIGYSWARTSIEKVQPGKGSLKFKFKVGKLYKYNGLFFLSQFKGADGNNWPWHVRGGNVDLVAQDKLYDLSTGRPGGLFTYDEPVAVKIKFGPSSAKGESKTLKYTIWDTSGAEAGSGSFQFTSGASGESVEFKPVVKSRGTFVLEGEVDGWGKREVFFARIPDVLKSIAGAKTPFGGTNLRSDAECKVARMIGIGGPCRQFFSWYAIQPAKDTWDFSACDKVIDTNRKNGIEPYICICSPPQWVTGLGKDVGYEPFPFDEAAWRDSVRVMSERWKDKIFGWEWLNEIVPGTKSTDPVADYVKFCKIGTEVAKKVNPKFTTLMAGGLWPRNFRNDCLKAGIGAYVDILPVHYSNMGGVLDAWDDLASAGATKTVVWDDETSNGLSTWDMPSKEILQVVAQSKWALDQWPDELVAGAGHINVFGTEANACGNWGYLLDDETVRPYGTTIAVLTSKIAAAKPVGKFFLPGRAVFHLFERDGKGVLIASSSVEGGEKVEINVGGAKVTATDYQGNETVLDAPGGKLTAELKPMRVFIEGAKLDVLKSYCVAEIGDGRRISDYPKVSAITGSPLKVGVAVKGLYSKTLKGSLSLAAPDGWPKPAAVDFSVEPGKTAIIDLPVALPDSTNPGEFSFKLLVKLSGMDVPVVEKPFGVSLISRDMVGNLLKNGGFETADGSESKAANWSGDGKRAPSGGGLGLGSSVLRFENAPNYQHSNQSITPPPGQTYLYSAWVWNKDIGGGSNIGQSFSDGKRKDFYTPQVFMFSEKGSASWHLYITKTETPQNLSSVSFTPVVKGPGWAMYDNLRVSLYEGTNYAAEAYKAKAAPKIDGRLDDWDKSCPIPLLCENQLNVSDKSYKWTPENLSGVAYLMWDAKGLYFAAEVKDDSLSAKTGEDALSGDSIALAIHPANRVAGKDDKAFVYYISQANPGGGSGLSTLYRPPSKSGGLSSGQLAKDSSVYELSIRRDGTTTVYELRMPWSELGGISPAFGSKFGLSIVLNDSDGSGKAASMSWGDGLASGWSPSSFGVATMVGE